MDHLPLPPSASAGKRRQTLGIVGACTAAALLVVLCVTAVQTRSELSTAREELRSTRADLTSVEERLDDLKDELDPRRLNSLASDVDSLGFRVGALEDCVNAFIEEFVNSRNERRGGNFTSC